VSSGDDSMSIRKATLSTPARLPAAVDPYKIDVDP